MLTNCQQRQGAQPRAPILGLSRAGKHVQMKYGTALKIDCRSAPCVMCASGATRAARKPVDSFQTPAKYVTVRNRLLPNLYARPDSQSISEINSPIHRGKRDW